MRTRTLAALVLIVIALALNVGLLIGDDVTSFGGWALVILLGAAGASLLVERRPFK